ncbi:MAG: hypothetical protein JWQ98_1184 [Chlorobi bacterium]|nr:hypothetical protein [Chlorobiota bacterium]
MNSNVTSRLLPALLAGFAILAATFSTGCASDPVSSQSDVVGGIYKPDSKPYGKTYAEWSATWWQWVFSQPVTDASGKVIHPLFDSTGANFNATQATSGSVIFLGGSLAPGSPFTRTITIPSGKALFFPMLNTFTDTTGGWTPDSMRVALDAAVKNITGVSAEIDGQAVATPANYHVRSALFSATLPDHNFYQYWGNPIPAGTVMPYLSDGHWLMVAPLASGAHTIHFLGRTSDGIYQEVTYKLTVQ